MAQVLHLPWQRRRSASIWLWRDGTAHPLVQPEAVVDPAHLVDLELVEWVSFDNARIPVGWRCRRASRRRPASRGDLGAWRPVGQARPNFRPDIQMLLAQGFAVLLPNVRGSSGYGRAYTESDESRNGSTALRTSHMAALARGASAIDAARIGIMGQSYGGFMVNAAITEHPALWRAAVSYYGIATS